MKHKKFVVGGFILCIAVGGLVFAALGGSIDYYNTIGELKERGEFGETVKVRGVVMEDSLEFNSEIGEYTFVLYDEENTAETLAISFSHALPDSFKEGTGVVAQGKLSEDQHFVASSLLVSCPSKYQSE